MIKLTTTEKQSGLWVSLEKQLTERLAMLRHKNDGDFDERETAQMRGQIKEIKILLSLAVSDQPINSD